MRWDELGGERCSVARTVAVIGDRWTLLILRDCFLRVRRFEEFEARLGVTRHILSDRLKKLVSEGVLKKVPYHERPNSLRISADAERPGTLSGADEHCALGRYPSGWARRSAIAAPASCLRPSVRSDVDLFALPRDD